MAGLLDAALGAWKNLGSTTAQQTYDYLVSRGMSPDQARREAERVGGKIEGRQGILEMAIPQDALDVGLMVAGGPGAKMGRRLAGGAIAAMDPTEAEAGVVKSAAKKAGGVVKSAAESVMNAISPRAPVTPEGLAVKGKEYSKAQREVLDEINAGPSGAGPLDLSTEGRFQADQTAFERRVPPRGVKPRLVRAMENEEVVNGIRDSIKRGMEMGADKWYHTGAIRDAFIKELGEDQGAAAFKNYMDMVSATSPRSDVSTNIRNASYYYMNADKGLPDSLPYPYGHVAQNLHRQNFDTVMREGYDRARNPKPEAFSANLQGNLVPVTVDTHAFRNIGIRTRDPEFLETSISVPYKDLKTAKNVSQDDLELLTMAQKYGEISPDGKKVVFRPQKLHSEGKLSMEDAVNIPSFWASKPNENEYGAAEQLYTRLAKEFNIAPADAQAAAWAGAGDITGLKSPAMKTFPQLFNERVLYTANMRGENPADTLGMFIRKEKPLLGLGAAVPFGAAAAGGNFGLLGPQGQSEY
jgi:hypothetical protein